MNPVRVIVVDDSPTMRGLITACLRRNRSSLSEACRSVFDQAGG